MTPEEYRTEFLEEVKARASAAENFDHSAFVDLCAELLGDADELADFEPCYHRGTGSRNRSVAIDGYAFDEVDGSLRLLVADFTGEHASVTVTQTQAKTVFGRLVAFCDDAFAGRLGDLEDSSPGHSAANMLFRQKKSIVRLRLYLVTDGLLSTRIKDWPEGDVAGIPAEFHIWDINRFRLVQESKSGRDELEVDLTEVVPGGLPCLPASVETDEYRAYLCVIPGSVLAEIYERFGSRLLEGNVRSFLGTRGRINKAIRRTVTSEPKMFFAYNNGIASTATDAVVEETLSGMRLTRVVDLQIVNGGQTTATLAAARVDKEATLDQTFVQMKLSVIPAENSGKIIPLIARYANSQNRVSDADFFSNHEFHRRIEQISRALRAPAIGGAQYGTHWRYERARGQYMNDQTRLSVAQRNVYLLQNPRKQLITKTDLAKYENTWRYMPHVVSQGAQKNFLAFSNFITEEWDKNPEQFNEEFYKRLVAKGIIYRRTEELVPKQDWYDGGYRANIVTYTVAKFANLIQFNGIGKLLDFKALWSAQATSKAMDRQLMTVAKHVFDIIVQPQGGFQNVTEWCKKEICWQRVRDAEIPFLRDLSSDLVDRDSDKLAKRDAEVAQSVMTGIQIQSAVVEAGASYWQGVLEWGRNRQLLSPDEQSILSIAAMIPRKLPTEKQCARLWQIRSRLIDEGYAAV